MVTVVAVRPMTYRTRRLQAGDSFETTSQVADIYYRLGKVRRPVQREEQRQPSIPSINGDDLSVLRSLATSLGIEVDGRWGVKRLKSEIAKR